MSNFRCIVCSTEFSMEEASRLSLCPVCYSGNQFMPVAWDVYLRLNWSEIALLCNAVQQLQQTMGPNISVDAQQAFRAIVARLSTHYPAVPAVPPPPTTEDDPSAEPVLMEAVDPEPSAAN